MIEPLDHDMPILAIACALDGRAAQIVTASGARFVSPAELRQHLLNLLRRLEANRPPTIQ